MKIRQGFVSNSSSSSFVLTGNYSVATVNEKLQIMVDCYNRLNGTAMTVEGTFDVFPATDEFLERRREDWGDYYSFPDKASVVIEDYQDNGIPYFFHDMIEDAFNCTRYHLG